MASTPRKVSKRVERGMNTASKRLTQVAALSFCAQLIALIVVGKTWAVLMPPVVASVPTALITMRLPETIRSIGPKLKQAYFGVAIISTAVVASFILSGSDPSFDLQFVRAMFAGFAILWLASTIAIHIATISKS